MFAWLVCLFVGHHFTANAKWEDSFRRPGYIYKHCQMCCKIVYKLKQ